MHAPKIVALALLTSPAFAQPAIGDRSPELGIEELLNAPAGAEATLESLRGRFVVLEFWATWCGPCVGAIPHMNRMHEAYGDRVTFISVTNEDRETVEAFQQGRSRIANWVGVDTDGSLAEAYAIRAIPRTVVLDHNGRVAAITSPFELTPERMDAYLDGERQRVEPVSLGQDATPADRVRAGLTGVVFPGTDPLDGLDESPHMQFILRPASVKDGGIESISVVSGENVTAVRIRRDQVLSSLYRLPAALIDTSALEPSETEYDFIVGGRFPIEDARSLALRAFDLEEHRELRNVTTYRLELAGDAAVNTSGPDVAPESNVWFADDALHLTDSRLTPAGLAETLTGLLGTPCASGLDPDIRLNARLVLPAKIGADGLSALLEEAHGVALVPVESEREVVVIRPLRGRDLK